MPQFDITTYASQLFWLFISFSLLYILVSTILVPRFEKTLAIREKKIHKSLKAAQDCQEEIIALQKKIQEVEEKARFEAHFIFEDALKEIEETRKQNEQELKLKLEKQEEEIQKNFIALSESLKPQIIEQSTFLTQAIVQKLAGFTPKTQEIKDLIKEIPLKE